MTELVAIDTHVAIWLYNHDTKKFSRRIFNLLEDAQVVVPAFVWLELMMMEQKNNKLALPMQDVKDYLYAQKSFVSLPADIAVVCESAYAIDWTRDPFDRLIVAEAAFHAIKLVTKDRLIRAHYAQAVW